MPVSIPKVGNGFKFDGGTPGQVVGALLPYALVLAGLVMLVMLVWGGITLMTAAGNPAKSKEGYGKIIAGLIGFVIVFVSYFVAQILQVMLGMKFL